MANETVDCFRSLLDSVPGWIEDLQGILQSAQAKQQELLFANQPVDHEIDTPLKRRRSKSSSMRSRRSQSVVEERAEAVRASGQEVTELLRPQLAHMTQSDVLRLSQRKRKTASNLSGGQSGPVKYRFRAMVVVYFDGNAQKQFETLARAVGGRRGAIRKGRMSAKFDNWTRNSSSSSSESESSDRGEGMIKGLGTFNYRTTRTRRAERSSLVEGIFDKVDGLLEKAQALVERAAHQMLRDGDCAVEVKKASEHFLEAQKLVEQEMPALTKRAEKTAERRRRSEEGRLKRAEEEEAAAASAAMNEKSQLTDKVDVVNFFPQDGRLEVDDGEASSEDEADFDVTAVQLPSFGGKYNLRSRPRLAAH